LAYGIARRAKRITPAVETASSDFYRGFLRRLFDTHGIVERARATGPRVRLPHSNREILEAIQQLTPAYRTVFNLYILEGYSHREIAELLNITESTSRSNLVKARLKLKEILMSRNYDEHGAAAI
jgi:RNA polymerase sigma-70 factor (ECF subfamily)